MLRLTIEKILHQPSKIALGVITVLIIVTLLNGILFFRQIFIEEVPPVIISEKPISTSIDQQFIMQIPAGHLFGQAPLKADNLTQTRLKIELNGIMLGEHKNSYAIIAEHGKNQKLYHAGDVLPGGAILHQITPLGVVIQYNGQYEQLPLARQKLNGGGNK